MLNRLEVPPNVLPMTYFIRMTRGVLLKGDGFVQAWSNVWPVGVFFLAVLLVSVITCRRTLD
jgi:ABC-2 type transport system permease protein